MDHSFAHLIAGRCGGGNPSESSALLQPIVDAQTQGIVGAALVAACTCLTPEGQGVSNAIELVDWIEALMCLKACNTRGHTLRLLAPVSEQQLHAPSFVAQLMRTLDELQIATSCIKLEISERIVVGEGDFMVGCLTELRHAGFSIVLDKLGSGYMNFSRWLDIPVTVIRIDEALALRAQSSEGAALIGALLKMASIRGLHTIAGGVESADAAAVLALLGVHRLQGSHFGPAMNCHRFMQQLDSA
jgi:EAL domain-containing protein (putative c-di-GMP-specific phosphodiesterase class I)